jgi:hypothetical protein
MKSSLINPNWPNALRWLLVHDLHQFRPWQLFRQPDEYSSAARAFEREDVSRGKVLAFASRQDCDDFAGLEIVDGQVTQKVICFHPVFGSATADSPRTWNIVQETHEDVFEFLSRRVLLDMKEWASTADAGEYASDA